MKSNKKCLIIIAVIVVAICFWIQFLSNKSKKKDINDTVFQFQISNIN